MSEYTAKEKRLQKLLEDLAREVEQGYAGPDLFDLMYQCDHLSFIIMTVFDHHGDIASHHVLQPTHDKICIPPDVQKRLDDMGYRVTFAGAGLWQQDEITTGLEDALGDWELAYFEEKGGKN